MCRRTGGQGLRRRGEGVEIVQARRGACNELVDRCKAAAGRGDSEVATPIVSTTEELSYPGYTHMAEARKIHAMAKKAKVAVLGTGVNPGFAMDALPIALTGVCERVDRISVHRIQDARIRRLPFQQKIGAGLTPEQFQRKVDDGSVRHVGLTESIAMIADRDGLDARPYHRRHPAQDWRRSRWRANSSRSTPATCAGSSRTVTATGRAEQSSSCTWKPIWRARVVPTR